MAFLRPETQSIKDSKEVKSIDMARYGKAKTESTLEAKSEPAADAEPKPFPAETVFYRRISHGRTARTLSVSAFVRNEWDYVRIDVKPHGRGQWIWLVTPLMDDPADLAELPNSE